MEHGKRKTTADAGAVLDRVTGDDGEVRAFIEAERLNVRVAELIFAARAAAGLTQAQLAKLVGTKQSVISRLEDADYDGRSLTMLGKIANALGQRLELQFVPCEESLSR